jgi:hypothetical protein
VLSDGVIEAPSGSSSRSSTVYIALVIKLKWQIASGVVFSPHLTTSAAAFQANHMVDGYRVYARNKPVRATSQNTKLTPTSSRHHATMQSRIQDAIEDMESLDLCETCSYRKMFAKYNADRTALSGRHEGL